MRFDGAEILEGQFCPHESVIELAWLNLEWLDIASQLFLAPPVHHLEHAVVTRVGRAVDDYAKVGLNSDRDWPGGRRRELNAGDIDSR